MAPPAAPPTRRPRAGVLMSAAAAALALLVAAPGASAAPPPPTGGVSLPHTSARVIAWSCPPPSSWRAPAGEDSYDSYDSYERPAASAVRLPAAAVTDGDWAGMGGDGWWRMTSAAVGHDILQFRPRDHSTAPVKAGPPITYRFTAPATGRYRWAMKAAAPHTTDHNDVWVRWVGTGGSVWGRQKRADGAAWAGIPTGQWTKIYTNVGGRKWAWGGYTKDHDAHMLITGELTGGVAYEFQMSGRSCQIQVAAFGLLPCQVDGNGSPGCANVNGLEQVPMATCA